MRHQMTMEIQGKRVLVVGFARSGRALVECLRERGATVTVNDARPPWSFASEIPQLLGQGIGFEFGAHRDAAFLSHELIVTSPGVPWDLPQLRAARSEGVRTVPEVEVAGWFLSGTLVGVTGSNGKTTTTALLGKMLEASDYPTLVGGNIGVPLVSAVGRASPDSMVVAELSSFQLEAIDTFHPHVAVLLNITPNHLDRHPSFEAYVAAKAQIFRNMTPQDYAVLNADDPTVMSLAAGIRAQKMLFSLTQPLAAGLLVSGGDVLYRVNHLERKLLATRDVKLPGAFNVENVLAAAAAACALGADFNAIGRAVREFRGVEHRLELVREVRGVRFYNDSKATSVDAAVKALSAFERGVHLILGGKDKGAPYAPLVPWLEGRVRETLLIGAAAQKIERELAGAVETVRSGNLETAVRQAFARAVPGDVILLAPACASFDQFEDFEHRGRTFKALVDQLAEPSGKQARWALEPPKIRRPSASRLTQRGQSAGDVSSQPPTICGTPVARESEAVAGEPLGSSAASNKQRGAVAPPPSAAPVPQVLSRPERVYVYEVGAEEVAPLAADAADANPEAWAAQPALDVRSVPESVEVSEAEPLLYECTTTSYVRELDGGREGVSNSTTSGRKLQPRQTSLF